MKEEFAGEDVLSFRLDDKAEEMNVEGEAEGMV